MNGFTNGDASHTSMQPRHRYQRSQNGSISKQLQGEERTLPMPTGGQRGHGAMVENVVLGAAKSPPKNKSRFTVSTTVGRKLTGADTSHVPCKFYLQGQCQAGRMCPFSHDIESTTRPAPCKYFAKGHCKFGAKCALLHITPDGLVVNRRSFQPPPIQGNGQMHPNAYGAAVPPGLLSLQAQGLDPRPGEIPPEEYGFPYRNGYDVSQIGNMSPTYGSPPQHEPGFTTPLKGLSVLDAPLPNSFDSNGISVAARNGPFAASVPSRFGVDSPPSSMPRKSAFGNAALQELHSSAFGDGSTLDSMLAGSPPSNGGLTLTFPKRSLYSERLRASRLMYSASVGTRPPPQAFEYSDEEGDTDQEESLLPASLRDLIPEGRSRRESRVTKDEETPASFLAAQRRTISSTNTPLVGSPNISSSPSRYSGMFAQRSASSDFIGSPLRNSGFPTALLSSATQGSADILGSPPRQASMSMLTQELQRTKLDQARSYSAGQTRTLSNGAATRTSLDRALSSTSINRERIDEEQELFDMDEIGGASRPQSSGTLQTSASIGSRLYAAGLNGKHEVNHGAIGSQRAR